MSTISQCERDISRYQTLKSNLNSIADKLYASMTHTANLKHEISSKYQIDDNDPPIAARTKNLGDKIEETFHYLKNTVIPAIDQSISYLRREIARLEQEERERLERLRREEEEKKKQQVLNSLFKNGL